MKIVVGAHPGLPFPFTNGPESPAPEPVGIVELPRVISADFARGRQVLGAALAHLISRSGFVTAQLQKIASWGLNEPASLDQGLVSRIVNARHREGAGLRALISLEALNKVLHVWRTAGREEAWAQFGPPAPWGVRAEWLEEAIWLPHPDNPERPLELCDFVDILVGRLDLPYLGTARMISSDPNQLGEAVSELLNDVALKAGLGPREAMRAILTSYPPSSLDRRERLQAVVLGEAVLTAEDLDDELLAIAEVVRTLRRLPVGQYGPAELTAELSTLLRNP